MTVPVTLVVIGASAAMNYHYMAQEGVGTAGQILGVVSVAFDAIKAMLPIQIAAAVAVGAWLRAGLGSGFLVLFLVFGLASALGFGEGSKGGPSSPASKCRLEQDLRQKNPRVGNACTFRA